MKIHLFPYNAASSVFPLGRRSKRIGIVLSGSTHSSVIIPIVAMTNPENAATKESVQSRLHKVLQNVSSILGKEKNGSDKVALKREVSLLSGVSVIVGAIIGSGIFISPKGVLECSGSVPASLIVWVACGIVTICGALCYAELATLIPLSGGEYIYLLKGFENLGRFGPMPAFLYLWTTLVAIGPSALAILSLTVAEYIIVPVSSTCHFIQVLKKLVAVLSVTSIAFINCTSVKLATNFNNFFTASKMIALTLIIIGGIVSAIKNGGPISSLTNFDGSTTSISKITTAIYFGMWAYNGWNSLNTITEEIVKPERNILLAILISIPLVTTAYVLTNIAYLMAISSDVLVSSDAVAMSFAKVVLGAGAPIIPILVAFSAYGCAVVGCLCLARMTFVAAREGHLMNILAFVHINNLTPVPAVLFNTMLAIIYLCLGDFSSLINFLSFVTWLFHGLVMIALIHLRRTKKNDHRPFKAPLICITVTLLSSVFLLVAPIIQDPRWEFLYAALFVVLGIVFYIPFLYYKVHLNFFDKVTRCLQMLLLAAPTEEICGEDCIQQIFSTKL